MCNNIMYADMKYRLFDEMTVPCSSFTISSVWMFHGLVLKYLNDIYKRSSLVNIKCSQNVSSKPKLTTLNDMIRECIILT